MNGTTTEDARSPLPARDPVVSARRIDAAAGDAAAGRVRLLLVDADEVAAHQLQRQLHEFGAGFEVAVAGRLSTALAHLATAPTDAVVADLSLPDAGGLETLGRLRAGASDLPILVLAGRDEEALALIGEAREMAELKGSPVMVDRLDELAAQAAPTRPV